MPFLPGNKLSKGRPKANHTLQKEEMRKTLVQMVKKEFVPLITSQLEAAKGLYYEKMTEDGNIIIYREKPDINASKYLLDQAIGRPTEHIEVSGGIALLVLDE